MRPRKLTLFLVLVLLGLLAFLFMRDESGPVIAPGSTLVLEIEGDYVEAPRSPLISRVLGETSSSFAALLSRLAIAERDDRIDTVVIVIRPIGMGWGKTGELREAIGRLGAAGRKTIAFLEISSFSASREYYLASVADEVYVVTGGSVPVVGLAAEYLFLGGLFEKLGVTFEVGKAGKYKSAVESYAGRGMSEASREMASSILDSTNDAFVAAIADGRGLDRQAVVEAIDAGPMQPNELLAHDLIDGSLHLDELLAEMPGEIVRERRYARVQPADIGFLPEADVAVIYASGPVVSGSGSRTRGGDPVIASETIGEAVLDAAEDDAIDAIILRIDSPGGSALASEQIWRAIIEAREHGKPIIASFSDMAASGGYYVATAADAIVSNGGTLTGSIGVFALRPVLGGALGKLGINIESMTRGAQAEWLLSGEPMSEAGRARLQEVVLSTYQLFLDRVSEGRDLPVDQVDEVAQGRVWTGRQAHQVGLVDELGGMRVALDRVRRELQLEPGADVIIVPYPEPKTLSEEIAELLDARIAEAVARALPLPDSLRALGSFVADWPTGSPILVPPVFVQIH